MVFENRAFNRHCSFTDLDRRCRLSLHRCGSIYMYMRNCKLCDEIYFSKNYCRKHYFNQLNKKPYRKQARKAYWQTYYEKHRDKILAKNKIWLEQNRELHNKRSRDYRAKLQDEVFKLLGNKCNNCGFDDPRAFNIDHINGRGRKEKRESEIKSVAYFYFRVRELINLGKNNKYQLLCANCNQIKRIVNKEY